MSANAIIYWGVIIGSGIGLAIWRMRLDRQLKALQDKLMKLSTAATAATTAMSGFTISLSGGFIATGNFFTQEIDTVPEPDTTFWTPEPILGWRQFGVEAGHLIAVTRPSIYRPGQPAECQGGLWGAPHVSPDWKCSCGYYANKEEFWDAPWGRSNYRDDTLIITAAVLLSGTVIEHERGYRAQYMELFAIDPRAAQIIRPTLLHPRFPLATDDPTTIHLEYARRKENYGHR